jgi:xanthine dehydrogenase accessory factor
VVEVGGVSHFINPYLPPVRIVAIGAVHISQALAGMVGLAGFDLRVIDPRTAFATPERFAGVDLVADWPADVLPSQPLDRYTALVALSHEPRIDDYPIAEALRTGCFYVGALGSRRTHAKRLERLANEGFSESELARIRAPIGLDIGAATPAEIAVSILSEIIHVLRRPEGAMRGRTP